MLLKAFHRFVSSGRAWLTLCPLTRQYTSPHQPAQMSPRKGTYHLRDKFRYTTVTGSLPRYGYGLDI